MATLSLDAPPSPLLRAMMLGTVFCIPIIVAVRPISLPLNDPDIWWHLAIGQRIVADGAIPTVDPLTQEHRPWVAYSWLYEVVLYGLYRAFGLAGIIVYRVVLSLALVAAIVAFVRRLESRFLVAVSLAGAATLAMGMLFAERPWLCSLLFSTLTLHAIAVLRQPGPAPRWILTLPIVYILWANIHIQFVYGLFILALGCTMPLVDRRLGWPQPTDSAAEAWSPGWRRLVLLSAACFAATFVTPFHVRLYGVVLEYATQPGPFRYVNELKSLEFREPTDWMMLALTLGAAFALGWRRPTSVFEVVLLVSASWFAFRARRDLWFAVLADLYILARSGPSVPACPPLGWPARLGIAGVLGALAALLAWQRDLSQAGLMRTIAKVYPVEAVRIVQEGGYTGPLYNDFNWGGYLAWTLPDLPVAIDGRTNLHGDARLERFGGVWAGMPDWKDDPDLLAAGLIIAETECPLTSLLLLDRERFTLVHRDKVACVFIPSARRAAAQLAPSARSR